MEPLVSVIVPCYNSENYIEETLQSILGQTYSNFEVIVVDDGSTDQTLRILDRYNDKIKCISQENSGPAVARNRGMFLAKGDLFAFCDSDDLWDSRKLQKQVDLMSQHPQCGMVSSNGIYVTENLESMDKNLITTSLKEGEKCEVGIPDVLTWARFYPSATMITKDAVLKTGLVFDSKTFLFEDVFLKLRIIERFKTFFLNESLVKRRYCQASLSHERTKANWYAQIKVFSFALIDFPEYRVHIKQKRVHSLYSVARLESLDGEFKKSRSALRRALLENPFLGVAYIDKKDSLKVKVKKIIAPYAILFSVFFGKNIIKEKW